MTEIKDRIFEFLRSGNKSAVQFAEEIGVQPSSVSHILSGRNKPSLDFVLKMLDKYKYLSTEWLLFGKGGMYKEQKMQTLFDESEMMGKPPEPISEERDEVRQEEKRLFESVDNDDIIKSEKPSSDMFADDIERIVWFYSDDTFRVFVANKKR